MKNGCLIIVVIVFGLAIIGSIGGNVSSDGSGNCHGTRVEIAALIRSLGPQYFKNPRSFEFQQRTMEIEKNENVYHVYFDAYAQNGFGAEILQHCRGLVHEYEPCKFKLKDLKVLN